ncbi:acyl-CoA carboxylase subunit epsilon [Pseudonocardia sp. TRM90224]|uniref:acyl-CoA carboxylase subunit epsilon n=1 Tax=Pseudonocardia sp. TRM90224 TaxID=2812678 RepID=UPI001E5A5E9B|nr:acyl-CoA carboxylase subunit epsilon [Pseudonocardia sp. TRM90224]
MADGDTGHEPSPEERRALFHIVRGTPSDEELAAVTVVLAAAASAGGGDAPDARQRDRWSDPAAALRTVLSPGRDAWRSTYWPR